MIKKSTFLFILPITSLFFAYILFWPIGFDVPKFVPKAAPELKGVLAPKSDLGNISTIKIGFGPEDVVFDKKGLMYSGLASGQVIRHSPLSGLTEEWVNTGGRPLGLAFDHQGNLVVADAKKGLLSITKNGQITTLASAINGVPFKFIDDLAIAKNGVIYFVDSSRHYSIEDDYILDSFMDGRPLGRLLSYDPHSRKVDVIRDKLFFPNGITMSHDGSAVLVSEMMSYRILRIIINGSQKGKTSIFADNLPGFPNNIIRSSGNSYWLALSAPRNPDVENLQTNPFIRKILMRLPKGLLSHPKPVKYGFIIKLNHRGEIIRSIQDPSGEHAFMLTSASEYQGNLYLGSIGSSAIKKMSLKH